MTHKDQRRRLLTAYHEAGHAVAAWFKRVDIFYVTIKPDDDSFGHLVRCHRLNHTKTDANGRIAKRRIQQLKRHAIVLVAGPLAEAVAAGRCNRIGSSADFYEAVRLTENLPLEFIDDYVKSTTRLLVKRWPEVQKVATALLEKDTLFTHDIWKLIQG